MAVRRRAGRLAKIAILLTAVFGPVSSPGIAASSPEQVRVGVLAYRGHDTALKEWSSTARYLTASVPGYTFKIVPLHFSGINDAVENSDVDFILANSSIYVELETLFGVSRIATMKRIGMTGVETTTFGGVIFSRTDRRDIEELDDLTDRRFMAVDETSLGGWRVAWRQLKENGLNPYRDFAEITFAGTHDAVVYAVRDGTADAGTVRTDILESMEQEGVIDRKEFRVLNARTHEGFPYAISTRLYPEWPFARVRHTPAELAEKVAVSLLNMRPEDRAARDAHIAGWTIPLDYQPVHECLRELRVGPYATEGRIAIGDVFRHYWFGIVMFAAVLLLISYVAAYVYRLNRQLRDSEARLRASHDELEQRVMERTREIQEANRELEQEIAARKKLEAQICHSQKLEAIGTLAGGVAHDFNNILTAIIGYGSILQMKMKEEDPLRSSVDNILSVAEKAAILTHSLLAFSRKQVIDPKPVNLHHIMKSVEKLIVRLIGEEVALKTEMAEEDLCVMADVGQITQIFMNLATNARDAMPGGGRLTFRTESVTLDSAYRHVFGQDDVGRFVRISVTDTGIGMDEEVIKKIFEPFFTTKEPGKGTGLGLAIVYGIVQQHDGYLDVVSAPGKGTTVSVYLPLMPSPEGEIPAQSATMPSNGSETVLIAEDDREVRNLAANVLREAGYSVIEAVDGEDALCKFRDRCEDVDLLLLDVIMPRKNGTTVAEEVRELKPGIRVLFASGYAPDMIGGEGILDGNCAFVAKPVSPLDLLRKVREVLEGTEHDDRSGP